MECKINELSTMIDGAEPRRSLSSLMTKWEVYVYIVAEVE